MRRPRARPRPLADFVETCLGPVLAAQGFARDDLVASWPEIAGARLAAVSLPLKLQWPRRSGDPDARPEPATLVLRIESPFALEAQHLAPLLVERINARYGWRCVGRILLKQGPVPRPEAPRPPPRPLGEAERALLAERTEGIEEPGLRDALARLGEAVVARQPDRR